ncbi:MAG: hypothetical protein Q7K35_03455 [bacterium]|nr:hypothetical protein [bacterium]
MKTLLLNPKIGRCETAFQNYLDKTVTHHPLPWRANLQGKEWVVVASDNALIAQCADWAQAQATVNYAHDNFVSDAIRNRL